MDSAMYVIEPSCTTPEYTFDDLMPADVPPWRPALDTAVASGPLAKEFSLATCSKKAAHNRTVTFQGFSPSGILLVATDRASVKVADIRGNPNVEIAWFIPTDAVQFRIKGHAAVIGEAHEFPRATRILKLPADFSGPEKHYGWWAVERERIWKGMGPQTAKFDHAPPRGERKPKGEDNAHFNYVLIAVVPERVEQLDLVRRGYTSWVCEGGKWVEEAQPPVLVERAQL